MVICAIYYAVYGLPLSPGSVTCMPMWRGAMPYDGSRHGTYATAA